MKKNYIFVLFVFLFSGIVFGQEAQKNFINYQGVARYADNTLMSSEQMTISIALKFGVANAAAVYEESHAITTDTNGVFSLQIGNGSATFGNYNTLPWGSAATFVSVAIDGSVVGTTEMMAVPYAISSGDADDQTAAEVEYDNTISGLMATTTQEAIDEMLTGAIIDADADPSNEIQTISFNATTNELSLTDGGVVTIPSGGADADADPTNELQTISFDATSNKISLTDGGEITIPSGGTDTDADPTNEIQDISLVGTELTITDGSTIDLAPIVPPGGTDDQNLILIDDVLSIENGSGSIDLSTYAGDDADADPTNEIDVTAKTGILTGDGTLVSGLVGTADGQVAKWDDTLGNWIAGTDQTAGAGSSLWVDKGNYIENSSGAVHIQSPNATGGAPLNISTNTGGSLLLVSSTNENVMAFENVDGNKGYAGISTGINDMEFGTVVGNPTGKVHLTTGTSRRLTVAANGDVGIGTINPTSKLDVEGDIRSSDLVGPGQRNVMADADGNLIIGAGGGGNSLWSLGNGGDINYTGGVVGIGTTTPGFALDISTSVETSLNLQSSDDNNFIRFVNSDGYQGYAGILNGNRDMDFGTGTGNTTGKVHLTIDSTPKLTVADDGNVGIGTMVPSTKLDVDGNIKSSGLSGIGQRNVMADADGNLVIGAGGGSGASQINDLSDGKSDANGSSLFLGADAGANDDGTNNFNVGVGNQALSSNTTGNQNTAYGSDALSNNTTGNNNAASGWAALRSNTTGNQNTANGSQALFSNTTGIENVAIGNATLTNNTTGNYNTANGTQALFYNNTGENNVAIGYHALYWNTTGKENVANGNEALYGNRTGNYNTANGSQALYSNTTGGNNVANGYQALYDNTTGGNNVANGYQALNANTTGKQNAANGSLALHKNTTGDNNTANGFWALRSNTIGHSNTANGATALFSNTSGHSNVANGYQALLSNTTGDENVANGYQALYSNVDGISNTANGHKALYSNTTGNLNTAIGRIALQYNTEGNQNTAIGGDALRENKTGDNNTALGRASLLLNTIGNNNTAVGKEALHDNRTGKDNTASGYQSLYENTGDANTANGTYALFSNTTGEENVANGFQALYDNTTGSKNAALGVRAGFNVAGNNNVTIGYNAGVPNNSGDNQVRIGNDFITYAGVQVPWTVTSDLRWKDHVRDLPYGLNMVSQLLPVDYIRKNNEKQTREVGFIAQEVEKALAAIGYNKQGFLTKDDKGFLSIRYNDFIPILTKAIQEQQAQIEALKSENLNHEKAMAEVVKRITALEIKAQSGSKKARI